MKQHKKFKKSWFAIGLIGVLLTTPNPTVIKATTNDLDPVVFNILRFAAVALILLPFILVKRKKLPAKSYKDAIIGGTFMAIAVISYTFAISLSQASYVSIITLLTPILLVVFSTLMVKERVTKRAVAGITLAAIGAMVIVLLPIAVQSNGSFTFYPFATCIALINCVTFPLATIYYRKANESGMSFPMVMSISTWIIILANIICMVILGTEMPQDLHTLNWLAILYSGVVVALIARIMVVVSYEHVGAAVISSLSYLETFIAILIPIAVLNEKLSVEMVLGGTLILIGVYVVEHHKSKHHKHFHIHRM